MPYCCMGDDRHNSNLDSWRRWVVSCKSETLYPRGKSSRSYWFGSWRTYFVAKESFKITCTAFVTMNREKLWLNQWSSNFLNITVFWDVTRCRLVDYYHRFLWLCYFQIKRFTLPLYTLVPLLSHLVLLFYLKRERAGSSETLGTIYQATRRHVQETNFLGYLAVRTFYLTRFHDQHNSWTEKGVFLFHVFLSSLLCLFMHVSE
jgi:hypothetical protein